MGGGGEWIGEDERDEGEEQSEVESAEGDGIDGAVVASLGERE